jgi:hypothetical protein
MKKFSQKDAGTRLGFAEAATIANRRMAKDARFDL